MKYGPLDGRTFDDAMAESHAIVERAIAEFDPVAVVALFSGGRDSTATLYASRQYLTHVGHCNTTIGIEATRQFVRDVTAENGLPLLEEKSDGIPWRRKPKDPDEPTIPWDAIERVIHEAGREWESFTAFEQVALCYGFPGRPAHGYAYTTLKQRALEKIHRNLTAHIPGRTKRVLYLSGARTAESKRRMLKAVKEIERKGNSVWVNPILHWSNEETAEYYARGGLPHNEVWDHLHLSGECLCLAFADPGEREFLEDWYGGEIDIQRILAIEPLVVAIGHQSTRWGYGKATGPTKSAGRLCSSCVGQTELAATL